MSIDQTKVIDFVGIEKTTGSLILTVSDHLDWSHDEQRRHIELLQDKLNTYLNYIESGQMLKDYPDAHNRKCVISVVSKYSPGAEGVLFFDDVRETLEQAGYELRLELLK